MQTKPYRLVSLAALSLLASTAQAHECHNLAQPNAYNIDQYYLCVGFSQEGPGVPAAGALNNLDMFPIYINKEFPEDEGAYSSLDTAKGDVVHIQATLVYLNDTVYDLPIDENYNFSDPLFFFKTPNVGWESLPAVNKSGEKVFKKSFMATSKNDWEGFWSYRAPRDFITPYKGMYAWEIRGTIQKKGKPAAKIFTKFTCQQPRIPYGPYDAADAENTLVAAPEGYFDCVRYDAANPTARAAATTAVHSPTVADVMNRFGYHPAAQ